MSYTISNPLNSGNEMIETIEFCQQPQQQQLNATFNATGEIIITGDNVVNHSNGFHVPAVPAITKPSYNGNNNANNGKLIMQVNANSNGFDMSNKENLNKK